MLENIFSLWRTIIILFSVSACEFSRPRFNNGSKVTTSISKLYIERISFWLRLRAATALYFMQHFLYRKDRDAHVFGCLIRRKLRKEIVKLPMVTAMNAEASRMLNTLVTRMCFCFLAFQSNIQFKRVRKNYGRR